MYIVTFVIVFAAICVYLYTMNKKKKDKDEDEPIESLKNALLAFALLRARVKDRGNLDLNYAKFDGTNLPMFSGCSLANTCFTYIMSHSTAGPFYSIQMEHKMNAVNKYLKRNLSTMDQVGKLFDDFVATIVDDDSVDDDSVESIVDDDIVESTPDESLKKPKVSRVPVEPSSTLSSKKIGI